MRVAIVETMGRAIDRHAVLTVKACRTFGPSGVMFREIGRWGIAIDDALGGASEAVKDRVAVLRAELLALHDQLWDAEETKDWLRVRALNVVRREKVAAFDLGGGEFAEPYTLGKGGADAS